MKREWWNGEIFTLYISSFSPCFPLLCPFPLSKFIKFCRKMLIRHKCHNKRLHARFGGPLRPPRSILVGCTVAQVPPPPPQMLATMFNHVQPVFNQIGVARAASGQIKQNLAIFGSKMVIVGPCGRKVVRSRLNIQKFDPIDIFNLIKEIFKKFFWAPPF